MKLQETLLQRSHHKCELCQSADALELYAVPPQSENTTDNCFMICNTCVAQYEKREELNVNHWRCLTTSMWSEIPAVQVFSWRMLTRLNNQDWAADNLDLLYLDEETLAWAKAGLEEDTEVVADVHKDANGNLLATGDSVVITKTLDVKGSSISAKLGTVVKNIRLVEDNSDQIEGRVEGQLIVILTKYVRKQSN